MTAKVFEAIDVWDDLSDYDGVLRNSPGLREQISRKAEDWRKETAKVLITTFPYEESELAFERWVSKPESERNSTTTLKQAVHDYMRLCEAVGQPKNETYWIAIYDAPTQRQGPMAEALKKRFVAPRQLEQEWRKTLDRHHLEWETEEIRVRRSQLFKDLIALLELFNELHGYLAALGLETGLLLDLSQGNLTAQDIDRFKRWAKYLSEDEGARTLCDLMGKMRQLGISDRIERAKVFQLTEAFLTDINSKEEIVGIRLGRELEYILPSELALLTDPETEVLFDLKFLEARLMCLDMQGMQVSKIAAEIEEDVQISENDKLGPMIICVDTSGSMAGAPETVAKAVALYMASKAKDQQRPCYLINFSTNIRTLDLTDGLNLGALIDFLKMSFHGGTDVAPALIHAIEVLDGEAFKNADVLVISDFIMATLPEAIVGMVDAQRMNGSRFNSLVLDSTFMTQRLTSIFDNEWIFDPNTSSIYELIGFQQRLDEVR